MYTYENVLKILSSFSVMKGWITSDIWALRHRELLFWIHGVNCRYVVSMYFYVLSPVDNEYLWCVNRSKEFDRKLINNWSLLIFVIREVREE
jgi:hypothetical protein